MRAQLWRIVSLSLLASCCSPSETTRSREQNVARGTPAPDAKAIFSLEITTDGGTGRCNATLLTPHLLLTAAHCVSGQFEVVDCGSTRLKAPLSPSQLRLTNAPDLQASPDGIQFIHPNAVYSLNEGKLLCGNDVALLEVAEAIPLQVARPLAASQSPTLETGTPYTIVGYGTLRTGTGEGIRRADNDLAIVCATTEECQQKMVDGFAGAPAVAVPEIATDEVVGNKGACPGDSGTPLLLQDDSSTTDEQMAVAAVVSRGTSDCVVSVFSRLSSWVFAQVRERSIAVGDQVPAWAEPMLTPTEPHAMGGQSGESPGSAGSAGNNSLPPQSTSSGKRGCAYHGPKRHAPLTSLLFFLLAGGTLWRRRNQRSLLS